MNKKTMLKGYIYVILSAVIFGLMPLMAKYIYKDGVNSVSLAFLRNALSFPVLFILSLLTAGNAKISPRALYSIGFMSLMGCSLTPILLFSSYNYIPSGTATIFHFIYPCVVMLGEYFMFKKNFTAMHFASLIFCILGIIFFYNPDSHLNFEGCFYALLSGVTYSVYVISLSLFKHKEISGFTFSFYIAFISSVFMFIVCILTNSLTLPQSVSGWLLTIFFALSLNVGAVVLFQRGTFIIGGGRACVLSTLEPVTSVFAGIIIFNESTSALTISGAVFVIIASILIAITDLKKS